MSINLACCLSSSTTASDTPPASGAKIRRTAGVKSAAMGGQLSSSVPLDSFDPKFEAPPRKLLGAQPVRQGPPADRLQIFVKDVHGSTRTYSLLAQGTTVADLAQAIEKRSGISTEYQRLIYAGRQLEHGKTLSASGLRNQSTVHLCLRLLGD